MQLCHCGQRCPQWPQNDPIGSALLRPASVLVHCVRGGACGELKHDIMKAKAAAEAIEKKVNKIMPNYLDRKKIFGVGCNNDLTNPDVDISLQNRFEGDQNFVNSCTKRLVSMFYSKGIVIESINSVAIGTNGAILVNLSFVGRPKRLPV